MRQRTYEDQDYYTDAEALSDLELEERDRDEEDEEDEYDGCSGYDSSPWRVEP